MNFYLRSYMQGFNLLPVTHMVPTSNIEGIRPFFEVPFCCPQQGRFQLKEGAPQQPGISRSQNMGTLEGPNLFARFNSKPMSFRFEPTVKRLIRECHFLEPQEIRELPTNKKLVLPI